MRGLLTLVLVPHLAWGHAGDIVDSLDVAPPRPGKTEMSIESSIGWLWAEDGATYQWICHEAVTQADTNMTPQYLRSPAGFSLAIVPRSGEGRELGETLYRTTDHCDWSTVTGLTNQVPTDLALDLNEPTRVFITTNGDSESTNGVYLSTDSGETWSSTTLSQQTRSFRSILMSDTGDLWVTATDVATETGWLHRSTDGGTTWLEWSIDLKDYPSTPDLLLLETDTDSVWFRVTQTLRDELWLLDASGPRKVAASDSKIMGIATINSTLYASIWNQGIAKLEGDAFSLVDGSPRSYAIRAGENTLYAATRPLFTDVGLMTSADGQTFTTTFDYADLQPPPTCAATSHSAQFCDPLWETLAARLQPGPVDTGDTGDSDTDSDTDTDTDTGCKRNKSQSAWLVLVLPLFFRRFHRA